MEGFEAYDFDGDERWTQYVARVEVAGVREGKETQTRGMRLLRAKWYKLNVDQDFDVDAVRRVGAAQASSGANSRQQAPQPPPTRPAAPRSQASVSSRASAGEVSSARSASSARIGSAACKWPSTALPHVRCHITWNSPTSCAFENRV